MGNSVKLGLYFKDYASHHMTAGNRATHYFGIPMIVISLLGLLSGIVLMPQIGSLSPLIRLDGGIVLLIAGIIGYLILDYKLGTAFSFVLLGFYFIGRAIPTYLNWVIFILGWILQGIGHYTYEKKSPAFFKNLTHLLIGPFWIFAKIVGYHPKA